MKQKLDFLINGKDSDLAQAILKKKKRKADYARKRRRREEALANADGSLTDHDLP